MHMPDLWHLYIEQTNRVGPLLSVPPGGVTFRLDNRKAFFKLKEQF